MTTDTRSETASPIGVADAPAIRLRRIDLRSPAATDVAERSALLRRSAAPDERIRSAVRTILDDVRLGGADAVRAANRRFGGGSREGALLIDGSALRAARDNLDAATRRALDHAIANVRRFAETQRPQSTRTTIARGIEIERRWLPLDRVGCYVPGGTAPYPSSLVMTVVPALVAGVGTVIVATPADETGSVHPVLLGAAGLLEVDAVLVAGGAQAVAALAFGLAGQAGASADRRGDHLEPVDRIVGPGNAWVTAAKLEIAGFVGIDLPAGPSEGMVLADAAADPATVAADLVTQAEHGPDSPAILVTTSERLADAVDDEIARLVPRLERAAILARALETHGRVILAPTLDEAIAFVDAYAPEHLSIDVADPEAAASRVRHAGSIFVGRWAPESAGDYATGANHVLPTGGLARSSDALSVEQFGRYTQIQRVDEDGLAGIRETVGGLATIEGLTAHRHAVEVRFPSEAAAPDTGDAS